MNAPPRVFAGEFAGRYLLEREVGSGATAAVFLAQDRLTGRPVAVKILRPELAESVGAQHFLREIRHTARLQHPRILNVLDSGEHDGSLYLVLPYMSGGTLRERLRRERQLPLPDVVEIGRTIADALAHAHAKGLIHRDVKPENILVGEEGVCLADFGIARVFEQFSGEGSSSGLIRGTPAYMSPEQAGGERDYDARSDVYSLACVLYELIAGVPAFIGATPQAVMAQRLVHPPRALTVYRPGCPESLDRVLQRALSLAPADRHRSAREFADELAAIDLESPSSTRTLPTAPASDRRARALLWGGGALAVAGIGVLAALGGRSFGIGGAPDPLPDTTRIALLPLERAGIPAGPEDELLYDAFARWRDIVLVDPFQVADAVEQRGPVTSDAAAREVARQVGAGRYVRGRLTAADTTRHLRAALYDLGSAQPLYVMTAQLGGAIGAVGDVYARLVDSLLLRGAAGDRPPSMRGGRSLSAVQAFAAGQRALDRWNLGAADTAYQSAIAAEPGYARAHLWQAQVRAWGRRAPAGWRDPARLALAGAGQLSSRERQLAQALADLADGRYERACATYARLRARNDRDFAALYGLGQCRTLDRMVLRDPSTSSGWRFRSSYHRAVEAYARAFEVLPSVHRGFEGSAEDPMSELRNLLQTGREQLTSGYSTGADSGRFLARVGWMGDTVLLVPYRWDDIIGGAAVYPPGFDRALTEQRALLRRIAGSWSAALPGSAGAKLALATSLEMLGDRAAADTLRVARDLTADPVRRLHLAAAEVLLRARLGVTGQPREAGRARRLADSLLASDTSLAMMAAASLTPVAELTGRCARAIALARGAAVERTVPVAIPRHYAADAQALRTAAAMGCSAPPTGPTLGQLHGRLSGDPDLGGEDTRRRLYDILLVSPSQLSPAPDPAVIAALARRGDATLLGARRAVIEGDRSAARALLAQVVARHGDGPVWVDAGYPEARLMLELGDSAAARRMLARSLETVGLPEPRSLFLNSRAGTLVRAMALRAALDHGAGDEAGARAWSRLVVELWSDADPELQPLVRRMRAIGGTR